MSAASSTLLRLDRSLEPVAKLGRAGYVWEAPKGAAPRSDQLCAWSCRSLSAADRADSTRSIVAVRATEAASRAENPRAVACRTKTAPARPWRPHLLVDCLEKVFDLGLGSGQRPSSTPRVGCALFAQMQQSDPRSPRFSELDYSLSNLCTDRKPFIPRPHLLRYYLSWPPSSSSTLLSRAGERAAMCNDDHPDLQVIDDFRQ